MRVFEDQDDDEHESSISEFALEAGAMRFWGHATPDRAGARPYHLQWRITSVIVRERRSRGSNF